MTKDQYPGTNLTSHYSEKLNMGYRWYDENKVLPAFPFGHGLSYTQFKYDQSSLRFEDSVTAKQVDRPIKKVTLKVENSGKMKGKEVV